MHNKNDKNIELSNTSDAYSATNTMKFDTYVGYYLYLCSILGNNMLACIVMDTLLLQYLITSIA